MEETRGDKKVQSLLEALEPNDIRIGGWASATVSSRNLKEIQIFDAMIYSGDILVGRASKIDIAVGPLVSAFEKVEEDTERIRNALKLAGEYDKENTHGRQPISQETSPSNS